MSLKFVPPATEAKSFPRYASYVHGSDMKTHGGIGFAKNSLNNRMWTYEVDPENPTRKDWRGDDVPNRVAVTKHAFLLEMIEGEYYVLYEIKAGSRVNDLPWMKKFVRDTKYGWDKGSPLSEYYEKAMLEDPDRFVTFYKHVTMTTDEYVQFRLDVQLEQLTRFPHPFREVSVPLED